MAVSAAAAPPLGALNPALKHFDGFRTTPLSRSTSETEAKINNAAILIAVEMILNANFTVREERGVNRIADILKKLPTNKDQDEAWRRLSNNLPKMRNYATRRKWKMPTPQNLQETTGKTSQTKEEAHQKRQEMIQDMTYNYAGSRKEAEEQQTEES